MNGDEIREDHGSEEKPAPAELHLTLTYAFGLLLLLIVLQLWVGKLLSVGTSLEDASWQYLAVSNTVSGVITAQAGALLAGFSLIGLLEWRKFRWITLAPIAISTAGVIILSLELRNLLQWIEPLSEEYVDMMKKLTAGDFSGFLLLIAVVAPVTEEWLFRGVILEGLRQQYPGITAVLASTLLFAIAHIYPWLIINAFFIGLFLAWVKIHTGSLAPCLFAHALYNSLPFLLSRLGNAKDDGFQLPTEPTIQFQPVWDLFGILLLIGGGILLIHLTERKTS